MTDAGDEEAVAALRAVIAEVAAMLREAGAREEALATYEDRQRKLLIMREPVLRPAGRVWRLGVLLLDADGGLHATGSIVRATEPGRTQYVSVSAETRRAYRAAAERGHFRDGETVNFDAEPVALDVGSLREAAETGRGPLFLREGRVLVRWSAAVADADARDAVGYLRERADLLAHPPQGA
ncbi:MULTISPECIES: hypothetical protein [Leifsonia]|uniref:Glutaminase n=3 Tax=Leifsonia TaxID=110932 RepID=A0A7W4UXW7_LEIAQ|nr:MULTISPECIES: hypothetical protein [Leifsonia]MBB2967713.1 hypothetical protein [Leifsonia aquatica]NYK09963.1 hypothetical protein [Leifsonia naganoensis]